MARHHIRDRGTYPDGTPWYHIDLPGDHEHTAGEHPADVVHLFHDDDLEQLADDIVAAHTYDDPDDERAFRTAVLRRLRGAAADGRPGAAAPDHGT